MTDKREKMLSAWLDGELDPAEQTAFEEGEEVAALEGERRFEAALAAKLGAEAHCPGATWRRLEVQLLNQPPGARAPEGRAGRAWAWRLAALAAVVLLAFGLFAVPRPGGRAEAAFLELHERSWQDLAQTSAIAADSYTDAFAYLEEKGFEIRNLAVQRFDPAENQMTYLTGVRTEDFRGESVGELLFNCCDHPFMIVLAKRGGEAAATLERVRRNLDAYPHVLVVEPVCQGEILAALVGRGDSPYLREFLHEHHHTKPGQ